MLVRFGEVKGFSIGINKPESFICDPVLARGFLNIVLKTSASGALGNRD
jgi:hypothetical protein